MANKVFHHNNRFNCSKTEHWHLACPLQSAECERDRKREMREGIWYNNKKGLEGREFNDECAFTEPWLRLWAWNCPSAMEQQPGLSIRTSPTWSVESGWINGIGGRFSHESTVFRRRMRSLALWERRDVVRLTHKHVASFCALILFFHILYIQYMYTYIHIQTCVCIKRIYFSKKKSQPKYFPRLYSYNQICNKHLEFWSSIDNVRVCEVQELRWWPEVSCQKQTQREHVLLSPQLQFLSTQLHQVLLWVCLTTSSCCWQRGQGSVRSSDSQNRLQ